MAMDLNLECMQEIQSLNSTKFRMYNLNLTLLNRKKKLIVLPANRK